MVITIGRQYGSGGRQIGRKLADQLDFAFYDNELLTIAAKNSGFDVEAISEFDEKPASGLMYNNYNGSVASDVLPLNQKLAFAQFDAIRQAADEGSCVIVGRCADYILRNRKDLTSVFIHAPLEFRKKVLLDYGQESPEKAAVKTDKKRASYYSFYTHKNWGDVSTYHLSIDSSLMGIDATVEALYQFMLIRIKSYK